MKSKLVAIALIENTKRELQVDLLCDYITKYQKICDKYGEMFKDVAEINKKLEQAIQDAKETLKSLGYDENGNETKDSEK